MSEPKRTVEEKSIAIKDAVDKSYLCSVRVLDELLAIKPLVRDQISIPRFLVPGTVQEKISGPQSWISSANYVQLN